MVESEKRAVVDSILLLTYVLESKDVLEKYCD